MRVIKEDFLVEDTLSNITANISSNLPMCTVKKSSKKNWIVITTPNSLEYAIPIEELSSTTSKDYKKARFTGNGVVKDGILTDSSTGKQYPCYIGIPTAHTHYDYNDNIKVYELIKGILNNPISFDDFVTGVNSGRF